MCMEREEYSPHTEHGWAESSSREINLKEWSAACITEAVRYIYQGQVQLSSLKVAQDLLVLAGHLQLATLETSMEWTLIQSLSVDTCGPMMYFAAEKNFGEIFQASLRIMRGMDVVSRKRAEELFALATHFEELGRKELDCQELKASVVEKLVAAADTMNCMSLLVSVSCVPGICTL